MVCLSFVQNNSTPSIFLNISYFANPHFYIIYWLLVGFNINCTLKSNTC